MARRELTESEKEQRRRLNEHFKGRVLKPIDRLDIGLPAFDETVCDDRVGNVPEAGLEPAQDYS